MKQIKFSSNYPKLWNQREARLLAVLVLTQKDLNEDLIEYDTKNINGEYYKLPETDLIQLVFIGDKRIPFCTLRRWTEEKLIYYHDLIGEYFEVVITENV